MPSRVDLSELSDQLPFLLPDILRIGVVEESPVGRVVEITIYTTDNLELVLPIDRNVCAALLNLPDQGLSLHKIPGATQLALDGRDQPIFLPLIVGLVRLVGIGDDSYVLEFLEEHERRILIAFSFEAYGCLTNELRKLNFTIGS